MSIRITQNNCVGCGRCIEACPGNLIKKMHRERQSLSTFPTAGAVPHA